MGVRGSKVTLWKGHTDGSRDLHRGKERTRPVRLLPETPPFGRPRKKHSPEFRPACAIGYL